MRHIADGDSANPLFGTFGTASFDVSAYDVIVVKNGYLFPSPADPPAAWFFALTPGGTDMRQTELTFAQRAKPLYPFETNFEPDRRGALLPTPRRQKH